MLLILLFLAGSCLPVHAQKDFGDVIVGETRSGIYDWQAPSFGVGASPWFITSVDYEAKSGPADFTILSVSHDQNRAMPQGTPRYCPLTTSPGPFHGSSSLQPGGKVNVDWEVKATGLGPARAALVVRGGVGLVGIGNASSPLWISLNGIYDIRRFEITHVGMRNSRILDIHTERDFGGKTYPVNIATTINGKTIALTANLSNNSLIPGTPFESSPVSIDLAANGVPRFSENVTFTVSATAGQVKRSTACAIPLPVVFVPGIDPIAAIRNLPTVFGGEGTFQPFENALDREFSNRFNSWGYNALARYSNSQPDAVPPGAGSASNPYYPTRHTLSFFGMGVDRNTVSLETGGKTLYAQIGLMLARTYADRVNVIAHSKGCLITRAMFAYQNGSAQKVNKCILIQGPHMGSAAASDPLGALVLSYGVSVRDFFVSGVTAQYPKDVYKNLTPLWNYVRPKGSRKFDFSEVNNPELGKLNKIPMPFRSGVKYYIFYTRSAKIGAYYKKIYRSRLSSLTALGWAYSRGAGDNIVPLFSQMGAGYNANTGKTTGPIPAFVECISRGQVKCAEIKPDHITSTVSPDVHKKAWDILWDTASPAWLTVCK